MKIPRLLVIFIVLAFIAILWWWRTKDMNFMPPSSDSSHAQEA